MGHAPKKFQWETLSPMMSRLQANTKKENWKWYIANRKEGQWAGGCGPPIWKIFIQEPQRSFMQSSYISLVEPDIIQHIHYLSSTYYATTVSWRHLAEHVIAKDKEACTTTPFAFNKPIWVARRASNWPGLLHHVDQKVTQISIKSNKSSRLFLKKVKQ